MFEMFECRGCQDLALRVRPLAPAYRPAADSTPQAVLLYARQEMRTVRALPRTDERK